VCRSKWAWLLVFLAAWTAVGFLLFSEGSAARGRPQGSPLQEGPRRIVSMAPALTEILFALGLRDQIVGVTT